MTVMKIDKLKACNIVALSAMLLSSCAPLLWDNGYSKSIFLGYGDYVSPYNSLDKLYQLFFVNDLLSLGGEDQSFNQSFIPFYAMHFILEFFGASSAVATVLMLCGLIFAAQFGFFLYIRRCLSKDFGLYELIFAVSGALIYGASTYFISNTFPGHISSLFLISFFPFLLRYYEDFIDRINYRFTLYEACCIVSIIVMASPAFANIGNFVAMIQVFIIFTLFKSFLWQRKYSELLAKFFYFIFLLILLNAWWMLSFAIDISDAIQRNEAVNTIGAGLRYATKYSTISNIFVGLPEAVFHLTGFIDSEYYSNLTFKLLMLTLMIFGVLGLLRRDDFSIKYQIPLIGILLFSVFISKGPNPPFGGVFMYAWDYVPTFQIFRRPASKMYWAYWFAFASLGVIGVSIFFKWALSVFQKKISLYILSVIICASLFSLFAFSRTTLLIGFNPSSDYYSAVKFLKNDGVKRVLMFPVTNGAPYTMNKTFNNYYGVDFFEQMLNSVILIPDFSGKLNANTFQGKINLIGSSLSNGGNVCKLFQDVGISHVVFSTDVQLDESVSQHYKRGLLNAQLDKNLVYLIKFGSLTIFKVSPICFRSSNEVEFKDGEYTKISELLSDSPVGLSFALPSGVDEFKIISRSNFSKNWIVDVYEDDISNIEYVSKKMIEIFKYVCKCNYFEAEGKDHIAVKHVYYANYGNQWNVQLKQNTSNQILTVTNIKQYFFYIGLFVSLVSLILFFLLSRAHNKIDNTGI